MIKVARLAAIVSCTVVGYLLLLVLAGAMLGDCVKRRVRDRIAESLQAEVTIGDASLSLVRGRIELEDIHIVGRRGGTVDIAVRRIDADLAPLGWALIDGDPRTVAVRGVDMTLSGRGMFEMRRPEARPLDVERFELEDVHLAVMPTTLLPELGRIDIGVQRARTGPVELRTGVSWIFKLEELAATAELPGSISVAVGYAEQELSLGGAAFGSRPMRLRFVLPEVDPDQFEIAQLGKLAKQLAKQLVKQAAGDWFEREVEDRLEQLAP